MSDFFSLSAKDANQNNINFSDFKDKTLIIANVATDCKLTKSNYESFKILIENFYDKGLRILLFPCSQFLNQESGDIEAISKFAKSFSDKLMVFEKVDVFGSKKHPVFQYLTSNGKGSLFDFVKWNFTKWIVKDGKVVRRYSPYDVVKADDLGFTEAIEDLILAPPFVDGKGVSNLVNLYGDYSVLSYGGDQHIKLGFMAQNTKAALVYRSQLGQDKFVLDIKVRIEDLKKGDENNGMLIFFTPTDEVELGSFYGIKNIEGFCVALDIKNGMEISVKIYLNNIVQNAKTFRFYDEDEVTVKISQGDTLSVVLDDTYDQLAVYDSDKYFISKQTFLGVSASNGNSSLASFSLRSIQPSILKVIPKIFERGEREGSSKTIWIVFVLGCAGLVYYLYEKQGKKRE